MRVEQLSSFLTKYLLVYFDVATGQEVRELFVVLDGRATFCSGGRGSPILLLLLGRIFHLDPSPVRHRRDVEVDFP